MHLTNTLFLVLLAVLLISCQGTSTTNPVVSGASGDLFSTSSDFEEKVYGTTHNGMNFLKVVPRINSGQDLQAYKNYKVTQSEEIYEMTEGRREDLPYFSAVITFKKPISLSEANDIIMDYNPTVKGIFKGDRFKDDHLFKADIVKGVDTMFIFKAKFKSTMGGGELPFSTLSNQDEMRELKEMIAKKEKELNGIEDFQFVEGITSIEGGVHRDKLMQMQKDSRVFLIDIGPKELYEQAVDHVFWNDIYDKVEQFYEE